MKKILLVFLFLVACANSPQATNAPPPEPYGFTNYCILFPNDIICGGKGTK